MLSVRVGDELLPEILLEALDEGGYAREDPVTAPGQMARRGGILDVFPSDADEPVRIEFFGDSVESLRRFDPDTQRSDRGARGARDAAARRPASRRGRCSRRCRALLDERFAGRRELAAFKERSSAGCLPTGSSSSCRSCPAPPCRRGQHLAAGVVAVVEPEAVREEARGAPRARRARTASAAPRACCPRSARRSCRREALAAHLAEARALEVREVESEGEALHLAARPAPATRATSTAWRPTCGRAGHDASCSSAIPGRADRLSDVLREEGLAVGEGTRILTRVGALSRGFEVPEAGLAVLADGDVFPEEVHLHARGRRRGLRTFLSDFRDLKVGDLVVHEDHGIGRFLGLETLDDRRHHARAHGARLPGRRQAQGPGRGLRPDPEVRERRERAAAGRPARQRPVGEDQDARQEGHARHGARSCCKLYAERKARPGHAFQGESPWQREFEAAFEYDETPDQAQAIAEVAADMASPAPMDRLVCGDVGYGKTEVAMRAAMRAVLDGKQVAVLAPTTVLAFQHWKTFRKRFAPFPVTVEMVSRFRTREGDQGRARARRARARSTS